MGYLAITVCAIAVTIWIIYRLANGIFHLGLKLKPLFLCAVCSLFISVIIPKIVVGFAGLAGTLVVLAIVAVIFAYFVAYYDDREEASKLATPAVCLESTSDALAEMEDTEGSFADTTVSDLPSATAVVGVDAAEVLTAKQDNSINELPEEYAAIDYSFETTGIDEEEGEMDIIVATPSIDDGQPEVEHRLAEVESVSGSFVTENKLIADMQDDVQKLSRTGDEEETVEEVIASPAAVTTISADIMQPELIEEDAVSVEAEFLPKQLLTENNSRVNGQVEDSMPSSLDELLDMAFTFKEQINNAKALLYFREALKLYPTSEAAPYLIVEIANILKNKGAYDEAIKIFTEGRNLPGLQQDEMLVQEFTDTIAYLRIVRNHLLQRHLGFVPYDKIPSEVFQDIDEEFREWRNLAS